MAKKTTASKAKKKSPAKAKAPAKKAAPKKSAAKKKAPKAKAPAKKAAPKKAAKPAPKAAKAPKASAAAKAKSGASLENLFTPLDDRLIVEAAGEATRTPGGLYIPDTVGASDRPKQGKVVAVGRGHLDKKGRIRRLDVQLGDTVMFESFQGSQMKIGDRDLVVLRESQVLGIVK